MFGVVLAFLVREAFEVPETEVGTSIQLPAQERFEIQRTRAIESQRIHDVRSASARQPSDQRIEQKNPLVGQGEKGVEEAPLFPVYSNHWGREAIPELRDFSKWADEYTKSPRRSKELVSEGVELAKARREMMQTLIQMAPEVALASAIPRDVRVQLPASVLNHSEYHISGIGTLEVAVVTPEAGSKTLEPLVQRSVRMQSGTYHAHVYGQMKGFGTVNGLYLHGVAVGDQLALADTPMRPLEVGEPLISETTVQADHPVSLSLANRVRGEGIGPFFAEGKEGYRCLCCGAAEWDNYEAYLGAAAGSGGAPVAGAIGRAYSNTGARKLLLIPVEFSDKTGSPWSTTAVRDSRISDIQSYFSATSYGIFTLPTVVTVPLQLMDNNSTHYEDSSAGRDLLKDHAVAKASTASYNSDDYDFVAIVLNHNWMSGYAGYGQVGAKFSWIDGSSSGSELDQDARLYIHELGHNLGLRHANAWDSATSTPDDTSGSHVEYGHEFDVMGDIWTHSYDKLHVNASFKNSMDWLADSSITTVTADTTTDLYAMDQTQVSGRNYAIKIPAGISLGTNTDLDYWIEFRSRYPSNATLDDGVLIYMSNDSHVNKALKLLDMNSATSSVSDAGLDKGESFTVSGSRWKITVNSQTGSGADSLVNVSIVDARPPAITVQPANTSKAYGESVTLSVTATGPSLTYQWYKDGTAIGSGTATLTISDFQESDKGDYHVVIENAYGTVTSDAATLSQYTGGGGGCGSVPPLTIFMVGWVAMVFNRLCLILNFGVRHENGRDSGKVKANGSKVAPPSSFVKKSKG